MKFDKDNVSSNVIKYIINEKNIFGYDDFKVEIDLDYFFKNKYFIYISLFFKDATNKLNIHIDDKEYIKYAKKYHGC